MTAMTLSASTRPLSISSASPVASDTLSIATLWTSMGRGVSAMVSRPLLFDDGAGQTVDGVLDPVQRCDHGAAAAILDEPHHGFDLGAHAAARELVLLGVRPQLGRGRSLDRPLLRGAVAEQDVL